MWVSAALGCSSGSSTAQGRRWGAIPALERSWRRRGSTVRGCTMDAIPALGSSSRTGCKTARGMRRGANRGLALVTADTYARRMSLSP